MSAVHWVEECNEGSIMSGRGTHEAAGDVGGQAWMVISGKSYKEA